MAPTTVHVSVSSSQYDVVIGEGLLRECGSVLSSVWNPRTIALVTDRTVHDLHYETVRSSLAQAGFDVVDLVIPPGETSKCWDMAGSLLESLAARGVGRTDSLVALGGGVVGDLGGFVAATYLRGVGFAQLPTTLLAQVDSSVGGKTGVDLTAGKNLAGAFIQPDVVVADTAVLSTLPEGEWLSGLAEVAKSGVLDGEISLAQLERDADGLVAREMGAVTEAVRMCVAFKARVVSSDERESGPRESLNLGHTLGHAIEKVAGYGVVPHGLAVAEGMRFAARLAVRTGAASSEFARRQDVLLDRLGLVPLPRVYDCEALASAMTSDKKARGGRPRFVLATAPGEHIVTHIDEAVLKDELCAWTTA